MKSIVLALFLAVCSLLLPNFVEAWSSPGHLTIAAIAYRDLSADVKTNVNELLKAGGCFAAQPWF